MSRRPNGHRYLVPLCYVVAGAVAVLAFRALGGEIWERLLYADLAATLAVFVFSFAFGNSSFYDPYWSVAPPVFCGYWLTTHHGDAIRGAVISALVFGWGMRLTWNWWRAWDGIRHEDWRYVDIRKKTGVFYWPISLVGLHLFPTVVVFVGCLSLWPSVPSARPFGVVDALATLVTLSGLTLEGIADQQLRIWTMHKKRPNDIFKDGLWGWMRHPNYLGEILFWTGLYLFAVATRPTFYVAAAGPVAILCLFLFVSIPLKDRRMLATRRDYDRYIKTVWAFWPKRPIRPD